MRVGDSIGCCDNSDVGSGVGSTDVISFDIDNEYTCFCILLWIYFWQTCGFIHRKTTLIK